MGNFKKLMVLFVIVALVLALVGCIEPTADTEGKMTVVVGETAYTVELSEVTVNNGLFSILDYLKETQGLVYETRSDSYGTMIIKANELEENVATGTYIYIYTSVTKDHDVSEYASMKEYNGTTLTNSGVGASLMSIEKDSIILIATIVF